MYTIRTEECFDSAHFLAGYEGKCSNLHGHRWRVTVEIRADGLIPDGNTRGMVADFGDVKRDLKEIVDALDHTFIYETGSLTDETVSALSREGFSLTPVQFRPTAENFAKYFFDRMREKGYDVRSSEVFETPTNSASYTGED